MTAVFQAAAVVLGLMLFLPLWRMVRGPTVFDRLVAAGTLGTKTLLLLLLMGFIDGRPDMYVDISLGYGLAIIVGTLVSAKYLEAVAEDTADPETDLDGDGEEALE